MEGVYVCDARNNSTAAEHISFRELASRGASPMDMMAVTFCEENGIPGPKIYIFSDFPLIGWLTFAHLDCYLIFIFIFYAVGIFNLHEPGNISRALCGERIGTLIDQTGPVA